jgi:menaquinone-specific isochorismate synthase
MQIIPSEMLPGRDEAALRRFLEGCKETAVAKNHFQVASISLAVKHIAPLAVLQSIYEPDELHFYIERPADDEAIAGAEAVAQARFDGPERFRQVQAFADDVLENTIVVGDLSEAFTGPHFFTAFSFEDNAAEGGEFPAATVFLPRWQVSRSKGKYGAVANLKIDAATDLDEAVARVWGAYQKFGAFDYSNDAGNGEAPAPPSVRSRRELAPGVFQGAVTQALESIRKGDFEKIVLARGIALEADRPWQPLDALNRLRERFGSCFTFSYGGGAGRSFIGATPERLLQIRDGQLLTEAIAGSAPRGKNASEDASLARGLLDSEKDLREHACVKDSILRRLEQAGIEGIADEDPRILPLANVQHLHTPIQAKVGESVHLLEVLSQLHPTPAVGGTPREAAVSRIRELEQMDRGLYAGVVGWFNHLNEGEMVVGIRSALIDGNHAKLYAGAGIVDGSDADKETRETDLKLNALLETL